MDNVIQNIKIEDITPSEIQTNISQNELIELINSMKKIGIIEPILVRPINGKYEIVLGNKIYQAAKQAGITILPAIVKNIDDDLINEYKIISNISQEDDTSNNDKTNQKESTIIQNNLNSNTTGTNSDIINLSELNKQEYEREDVKMNNEINNNMMNNNLGANINNNTNGEPTFGGKFFPSLEDEPTNMNMGGIAQQPQTNQSMPKPSNPLEQNNLIDLTDNGIDSSVSAAPNPQNIVGQDFNNAQPIAPNMNSVSTSMENQVNVQTNTLEQTMPTGNMGNTISLDNLTSQYAEATPQAPFMNNQSEPNMPQETIPQFDMSQSIAPNPMMSPDINLGANSYAVDPVQDSNQMNSNMDIYMPNYNEQVPDNTQQTPDYNVIQPAMPQEPIASVAEQPIQTPVDMNISAVKDTTPVINTIKALAANLEAFGYTINITDEELASSTKITIEIQK